MENKANSPRLSRRGKIASPINSNEVFSIEITKDNYLRLEKIIQALAKMKIKRLVFEMPRDKRRIVRLTELAPLFQRISQRWSEYFQIALKNIPHCILGREKSFVVWKKYSSSVMPIVCKGCRDKKICRGVSKEYAETFGLSELGSVPDLPNEVVIEVEPRCNFDCQFCFNKLSFAREGRNQVRRLSKDYIKNILIKIADAGIRNVRFTGGEPMLNPDILEILAFAKNLNFMQVKLNTNASLIDKKMAEKLVRYVDNFLIPLESASNEREKEICGGGDVFKAKLNAVKFLREAGAKLIRIGTVATKNAIKDFEQIERLVFDLGVWHWELFRPIPFNSKGDIIDGNDIEILVNKLRYARLKRENNNYLIANALPFCVVRNTNLINSVSMGSFFDDGHTRFVVDPRGFAKPHYFIDENVGSPLEPLSCWQNPLMKKLRNLQFLPDSCKNCHFKFKCRGGSRRAAMLINGSYYASDPLAKLSP